MKKQQPPMRSLLSRDMVLEHIKKENIFINPFNYKNLGTTSYDIRLGENFFQEQSFRASNRKIFNPFNPQDIIRYWGEPQKAVKARDWIEENGPLTNIKPEDKIIILRPGETILAHSEEFIGGRNCISTEMRARSSIYRKNWYYCLQVRWLGRC